MISGITITFIYSFIDVPSPSERRYTSSLHELPLFFGTAIFAFEGIALVSFFYTQCTPAISKNSLLTRQNFIFEFFKCKSSGVQGKNNEYHIVNKILISM
jgi:hypothetical protein